MDITEFNLDFFSLAGKVAIVTGGNTGVGRAFSLALAKSGANILVPSLIDDDGTTQKIIEETGSCYVFMEVDLTEDGVPKQVVEHCVRVFGSVDILVNCAEVLSADVISFDRKKWDTMIQLNLTSAFDMAHEVAKVMIPQNAGKIINLCSLSSYLGEQNSPANAAAKHGLVGLTKAYCAELAAYNIQVNGLAPGYVVTDRTKHKQEEAIQQNVLAHLSTDLWGELADLMGAVVYLASPASNFVNGHILTIDGGYLVR